MCAFTGATDARAHTHLAIRSMNNHFDEYEGKPQCALLAERGNLKYSHESAFIKSMRAHSQPSSHTR